MKRALALARRARGLTSPNPMVGAVLTQGGEVLGEGWHRRAGEAHAEVLALEDAQRRGCRNLAGATLYVTLEPCCTQGRTPPCTEALIHAGLKRVVVGAIDPNPRHGGEGLAILRRAGIEVLCGVLGPQAEALNAAFNYWIVHRRPWVTVKAAMTLDGKIATATGESKWITGPQARAAAMRLRLESDAILAGVNTILADDPALTFRGRQAPRKVLRRIVLDSRARTPLRSRVVADEHAALTTLVVTRRAPRARVSALQQRVRVVTAPTREGRVDLEWVLDWLGAEEATSLLVEGGGEINASFLLRGLAHRIAFFYAPRILGGATALKAVGGRGLPTLAGALRLADVGWRQLGCDLLLTARVAPLQGGGFRTGV